MNRKNQSCLDDGLMISFEPKKLWLEVKEQQQTYNEWPCPRVTTALDPTFAQIRRKQLRSDELVHWNKEHFSHSPYHFRRSWISKFRTFRRYFGKRDCCYSDSVCYTHITSSQTPLVRALVSSHAKFAQADCACALAISWLHFCAAAVVNRLRRRHCTEWATALTHALTEPAWH